MFPSPKGQLYTTNWRITRLSSHSEQNIPSYWIQQANYLQFWQVEKKKTPRTDHPSKPLSVTFPSLQEDIQKVQFMHFITTDKQPAKNYLPHWLLHTHLWLLFIAAFGEKGQRECHQFNFLNGHVVWPGTLCREYHGDSQEAIVHMVMVEHGTTAGVGKHLVPTSAVPSGFQLGDWR